MVIKISPSILSANFLELSAELGSIKTADMVHIDIMDGNFVPPITFGAGITSQIKSGTELPLDVHLMVAKPEQQIPEFIKAGADCITFHYEATAHSHRLIQVIKDAGLKAGISINPATPSNVLEDILNDADIVLVMSVNPGWGGQKFIPGSIDKIKKLKGMISNSATEIMVDGGVNDEIAPRLIEAGATVLVSGSYIFKQKDRAKAIESLKF